MRINRRNKDVKNTLERFHQSLLVAHQAIGGRAVVAPVEGDPYCLIAHSVPVYPCTLAVLYSLGAGASFSLGWTHPLVP